MDQSELRRTKSESSSSEDDSDAELLTEELERGFLKVLSFLKKKDNNLYDNNTSFFSSDCDEVDANKHAKGKPDQSDYKEWLKGHVATAKDKKIRKELSALHDFWANPNTSKDEKFLRDYILNKKFLDPDESFNLEKELIKLNEEEKEEEEQAIFEEKYNCRFENPDFEFLNKYPHTMKHALSNKTDDDGCEDTNIKLCAEKKSKNNCSTKEKNEAHFKKKKCKTFIEERDKNGEKGVKIINNNFGNKQNANDVSETENIIVNNFNNTKEKHKKYKRNKINIDYSEDLKIKSSQEKKPKKLNCSTKWNNNKEEHLETKCLIDDNKCAGEDNETINYNFANNQKDNKMACETKMKKVNKFNKVIKTRTKHNEWVQHKLFKTKPKDLPSNDAFTVNKESKIKNRFEQSPVILGYGDKKPTNSKYDCLSLKLRLKLLHHKKLNKLKEKHSENKLENIDKLKIKRQQMHLLKKNIKQPTSSKHFKIGSGKKQKDGVRKLRHRALLKKTISPS